MPSKKALQVLNEMISKEKGLLKKLLVLDEKIGELDYPSEELKLIHPHINNLIDFSVKMNQNLQFTEALLGTNKPKREKLMTERHDLIKSFIEIRKVYDEAYYKLSYADKTIQIDGFGDMNAILLIPIQRGVHYKLLITEFLKASGDDIDVKVKDSCNEILATLSEFLDKSTKDRYEKARNGLMVAIKQSELRVIPPFLTEAKSRGLGN